MTHCSSIYYKISFQEFLGEIKLPTIIARSGKKTLLGRDMQRTSRTSMRPLRPIVALRGRPRARKGKSGQHQLVNQKIPLSISQATVVNCTKGQRGLP